jgi:hypothetical protein
MTHRQDHLSRAWADPRWGQSGSFRAQYPSYTKLSPLKSEKQLPPMCILINEDVALGFKKKFSAWKDKTHRRQCKMSSSKELTCKVTLRQVFICLRPRTPGHPPLTHCIRVHSIHIHTGRGEGGRVEPVRRLQGQQFTKLGWKYQHDWLYLQSINSDKTPAAKSLTR